MKKCVKIVLLIFVVFFYAVRFVFPQTDQYKFRHLTTKQGLPSNSVNSIIKDREGFMWFGTGNGLARYDGYNLKTYQITPGQVSDPGSQEINKILEDNTGNLWVGTSQHGLQLFDRVNESFTGFVHNPDNPNSLSNNTVNTIYEDREGDLWIGTNDGLNKFNPKSQIFTSYSQESDNTNDLQNKITVIFEDISGRLWIGTGNGLFLFDRKNEDFTPFELGKNIPAGKYGMINCIMEDRNDILWIATMWGMFKYDKKNQRIKNFLPFGMAQLFQGGYDAATYLSNLWVHSIVEDAQNRNRILWIATSWGLNKFDIESEEFETISENPVDPHSISTVSLKELFLDAAGQLWIGTQTAGMEVLKTKTSPFKQVIIRGPDHQYYYSALSFLIDSKETLWVGAMEEGIFEYDKDFNLINNYKKWDFAPDKPFNNRITCIYEDPDNILWFGFYEWGLILFDREQKTFQPIKFENNTDALKPSKTDNILRDQYGILWIGTDAGLYFKNKNEGVDTPIHIYRHQELHKADIVRIFEDGKRNLWISTRNSGLFRLSQKNRHSMTFIRYIFDRQGKNGFFGNYVSSIYEDQGGTLWFGSNKGLNKFNFLNEKFEPEKRFNNDHAGLIIRFYGDNDDNLWLFHAKDGLIRYNLKSAKE